MSARDRIALFLLWVVVPLATAAFFVALGKDALR